MGTEQFTREFTIVTAEELADALEEMARQHIPAADSRHFENDLDMVDSMAISANRDSLLLLAKLGRFIVLRHVGRRVVGYWKKTAVIPELQWHTVYSENNGSPQE